MLRESLNTLTDDVENSNSCRKLCLMWMNDENKNDPCGRGEEKRTIFAILNMSTNLWQAIESKGLLCLIERLQQQHANVRFLNEWKIKWISIFHIRAAAVSREIHLLIVSISSWHYTLLLLNYTFKYTVSQAHCSPSEKRMVLAVLLSSSLKCTRNVRVERENTNFWLKLP